MSKWYSLALVTAIAFVAAAGWWLARDTLQSHSQSWFAGEVQDHEEWFSIQWYERPVGEASLTLQRLPSGQVRVTELVRISGKAEARDLDMQHIQQLIFAANPPYNVESGSVDIQETDRKVNTQFTNGTSLVITSTAGANVERPPIEFTLDHFLAARQWIASRPEKAEIQQLRQFDFDTFAVTTQEAVVLDTPENSEGWHLSFRNHGDSWSSLVTYNAAAVPLHFSIGSGMELSWQPERPGLQAERSDFYQHSIVTLDQTIGEPNRVGSMSLLFDPANAHWFIDQPGLLVSGGNQLRTQVGERNLAPNARRDYLELDEQSDYNRARIERMARVMMSDLKTDSEKIQRLLNFVHHHIAHQPVMSELSVDEILAKRKGDCTEYALLFMTLAKTAGIPAREINGLVYLGDEMQGFGGHTWVEVALNGQWHAVDPTWNLFEITGTHIRLGEGEAGAIALMQARRELKFQLNDIEYIN